MLNNSIISAELGQQIYTQKKSHKEVKDPMDIAPTNTLNVSLNISSMVKGK
jgi:hypothetical protein